MLNRIVCFLVLLMTWGSCVHGQSVLSSIMGGVTDESGARVAGAAVTLRDLDKNTSATVTSGGRGFYEFPGVSSGRYQLTARCPGFADQITPEVYVAARQTRRIEVKSG